MVRCYGTADTKKRDKPGAPDARDHTCGGSWCGWFRVLHLLPYVQHHPLSAARDGTPGCIRVCRLPDEAEPGDVLGKTPKPETSLSFMKVDMVVVELRKCVVIRTLLITAMQNAEDAFEVAST